MLQSILRWNSRCVLGLDISDQQIKAVAIKKINHSFYLEKFCSISLPPAAVIAQEIKDSAVVTAALQEVHSLINKPVHSVAAALPYHSVIIKTIEIEQASLPEMEAEITLAASEALALNIAELALDYEIVSQATARRVKIIYSATKKHTVFNIKNVLKNSGFKLKVLDVDAHVLFSLLKQSTVNDVTALFCIDQGRVLIIVSKQQQLLFAHSEKWLQQDRDPLLKTRLISLQQQLNRCWQFYLATTDYQPVMSAFIAGEEAYNPEIQGYLTSILHLPVQLFNEITPLHIKKNIKEEDFLQQIPLWLLPLQLAIRGWQHDAV